jgi:hypothetical protein
MGRGAHSPGVLTTRIHLVPRLRIRRVIPYMTWYLIQKRNNFRFYICVQVKQWSRRTIIIGDWYNKKTGLVPSSSAWMARSTQRAYLVLLCDGQQWPVAGEGSWRPPSHKQTDAGRLSTYSSLCNMATHFQLNLFGAEAKNREAPHR